VKVATLNAMELARQWGLADAAYFYTTSAADAQLEASTLTDAYLVRTTNSAADALVLVVKQAGHSAVVRYLFQRVNANEWRSVHGNVRTTGAFTDFLKVLIGSTRAVPLVDVERVKQQQEQQRSRSLQEQTLRVVRKNSAPLVAHDIVAAPTEWLAVVRANALVALDPVHNDVDGVSLALEPHYFGADVDALGAAALLAGRPPTTFLARLGGADRKQTVVSAVRASGQLGHVVMDRAALIRPTVRESILATPAFRLPLTRSAVEREFVPCTVRLAEQPLGAGAASVVLRGQLDNRIDVAVKRLVTTSSGDGRGDAVCRGRLDAQDCAARQRRLPVRPGACAAGAGARVLRWRQSGCARRYDRVGAERARRGALCEQRRRSAAAAARDRAVGDRAAAAALQATFDDWRRACHAQR